MNWFDTELIYFNTTMSVERAIGSLFGMMSDVVDIFDIPVSAAAMIYIALVGYGVMSGAIAMSTRELAVRFAKVVGIILIMKILGDYGGNFYRAVWEAPDSLANYFAQETAPILGLAGVFSIDDFDAFAAGYSAVATILSAQTGQAYEDNQKWAIVTWMIAMAPLAVTIIAVYLAKVVSALLFLISPIVFILSLTVGAGQGHSVLMTWFKAIFMTFLTVIIVYIIGITSMLMTGRYMIDIIGTGLLSGVSLPGAGLLPSAGAFNEQYSLPRLAPVGILAMLSVVLVSQATTIASSLLGVAALNTQQATSFLQIGALQAANKV